MYARFVVFLLAWIGAYAAWFYFGHPDWKEIQQEFGLWAARFGTRAPSLLIFVVVADIITPGEWLEKIDCAPYGPTIVTVALILGAAWATG